MEKIHVWAGYGKKERYVDARTVKNVNKFINETIDKVRGWGWQKQLIFYIGSGDNKKRIVVE